ncbi:hypothetical protein PPSIR1_24689 [Plesiocystis pacifica SIR-1]|uniref:Uncharacterized protein n=1 Tax=Plesiocystis pacifica SIR-1 TaxID=391625 RepID=A6GB85_9BACT|nr:hypothetical protein [Plesiocystis pacifica]EDM76882.1 hypothetical protein PPSIR1_24689 [Plesiocystis pacifica SIR-1]
MAKRAETRESSVLLALAELDQLEHSRRAFSDRKRELLEASKGQARSLTELRARFEGERPKAWARRRARQDRQHEQLMAVEREAAAHAAAEQVAAHERRMTEHARELEAKRRRLVELESIPEVVTPGRKLLEWCTPLATAAMVALLFAVVTHEDEASADTPMHVQVDDADMEAPFAGTVLVPAAAPMPEAPEAPEPAPEKKTTKKSTKKSTTKKSTTKKSTTKTDSSSKSGRKNPLVLDFGEDPLG